MSMSDAPPDQSDGLLPDSGVDEDTRETLKEIAAAYSSIQSRVAELEESVADLEETNEELRDELEKEREQREQAEEFIKESLFDLEELVTGEYEMLFELPRVEDQGGILERLENLETDGVDTTDDVLSEHALPIQRKLRDRKADVILDANIERATYVWEDLTDHWRKEGGKFKLDSDQVRNILVKRADEIGASESTLRNYETVRRVMKHLAKRTGFWDEPAKADPESKENLIHLKRASSRNVLIASQDEWNEWYQAVQGGGSSRQDGPGGRGGDESANDPVSPEDGQGEAAVDERVFSGDAVTSAEEDSVQGTIETSETSGGSKPT